MTIQIAIDGPASSGKSTIAKQIARQLNIAYVDSGAIYRTITYALLENNIQPNDSEAIKEQLQQFDIELMADQDYFEVRLNQQPIGLEIRSEQVTAAVSEVSAYPFVREYVNHKLQQLSRNYSVIMDGRDIGTVVLPEAEVKIFLTASAEVRAQRRYEENKQRNQLTQSYEDILQAIIERDRYDSNRKIAPLRKAEDAIEVDTSNLTVEEVVNKVISMIQPQL
ncbi:(d)CMP kinase [Falseniella ignava]|uniref:Cytidylate kinase n=1 Tax=Falseniella ignava CCUG 37419 TaxID=883112 RepID=K1M459_9LACT|nr:(d)CMP kinase [Falseniella ignava]EKB57168.1 cytidylate kinase [Falseniella ignava CCUG 37419]